MPTLTLDEAAALLKTSPDTVSDCVHNRGLPAAKVGRAFVLVEADVIDWLRGQYGAWKGDSECGSTNEARPAPGGSISAKQAASALAEALGQPTSGKRRRRPPRLRAISGGSAGSEKRPG